MWTNGRVVDGEFVFGDDAVGVEADGNNCVGYKKKRRGGKYLAQKCSKTMTSACILQTGTEHLIMIGRQSEKSFIQPFGQTYVHMIICN